MSNRIKQFIKYTGYIVFAGVLWGLLMYLIYIWLAAHSLLLAYIVNFALIIIALIGDESVFKMFESSMTSKEALVEMKKSRFVRFFFDSYISFKAALYLFYIAIMIFSQAIGFYPTLVNESFGSFIIANEYNILLLIAVDLLSGQLSKDRGRRKSLEEKFNKALEEVLDE